MHDSALATDAAGSPVVLSHFRAERGVNDRDGQWAAVSVRRTLRQNGDVAAVQRRVIEWFSSQRAAAEFCEVLATLPDPMADAVIAKAEAR